MSESKKLIIGFAIVCLVCICAGVITFFSVRSLGERFEKMVEGDPTSVAETMDNVANFDVPDGYELVAFSMLNSDFLTLSPTNDGNGPMIMIMQTRAGNMANQEQFEEQFKRSFERQFQESDLDFEVVDSFEREIRGEMVTVTVSEDHHQGFVIRQWFTIFMGNKGPAILSITGAVSEWDEELVDEFVSSIR